MLFLAAGTVVIIFGLIWFILFTPEGSSFLFKNLLARYTGSEKVDVKRVDGKLVSKVYLQDIQITNAAWLPSGASLFIKELDADINFLDLKNSFLEVHNAVLKLSDSSVFLFHGKMEKSLLEANLYSKSINLKTFAQSFPDKSLQDKLSGIVEDIDIYFKGSLMKPKIVGSLSIRKTDYDDFSVQESPINFDFVFSDLLDDPKIFGTVFIDGGILKGKNTAVLTLKPSKLFFYGDYKNPQFDLKASSVVEKVKINLALKGDLRSPDLRLISDPHLSQEQLLMMLATNKRWKEVDKLFDSGSLSAAAAVDFMDYFIFSSSAGKLSKMLGISDFSFKFDKKSQSASVTKEINPKTDVTYGVSRESIQVKDKPVATHNLGAEYKITDNLSVSAEKEIKQYNKESQNSEKEPTNDKLLLKYQKNF